MLSVLFKLLFASLHFCTVSPRRSYVLQSFDSKKLVRSEQVLKTNHFVTSKKLPRTSGDVVLGIHCIDDVVAILSNFSHTATLPIPLDCEIPFPEEQIVQGSRVVNGKRLIIMMIITMNHVMIIKITMIMITTRLQ